MKKIITITKAFIVLMTIIAVSCFFAAGYMCYEAYDWQEPALGVLAAGYAVAGILVLFGPIRCSFRERNDLVYEIARFLKREAR